MIVEKTGKTIDEAVELALKELNRTKEQVEIEILSESKGIFGLFGNKEARVRVTSLCDDTPAATAQQFLETVFGLLKVDAEVETTYDEEEKRLHAEIKGENVGILIGRRGETLDALQYLTSLIVNKTQDEFVRATVDTENYREKRKATLIALANKVAGRVAKYKRSVSLEPMNPYERRIIHETLQSNKLVTTFSTGTEPNRKVVVALKNNQRYYRRPVEEQEE